MASSVQYHHLNDLTQIRHFKSRKPYRYHIFGESIGFRVADTSPSLTGKAIEEVIIGSQVPNKQNGKMYSVETHKLYFVKTSPSQCICFIFTLHHQTLAVLGFKGNKREDQDRIQGLE